MADKIGKTPFKLFVQKSAYNPSGIKAESLQVYQETPVSVMTQRLVERWGMVAAKDDGTDDAGRAKMTLLDPEEVVQRAIHVAQAMYRELEIQGYIAPIDYTPNVKEEDDL